MVFCNVNDIPSRCYVETRIYLKVYCDTIRRGSSLFPLRGIILSVRIYSTVCTALQLNSIIEDNFYIQQACVGPSLAQLLKDRRWCIHCPCSCKANYNVLPTTPIITRRFPNTKEL